MDVLFEVPGQTVRMVGKVVAFTSPVNWRA